MLVFSTCNVPESRLPWRHLEPANRVRGPRLCLTGFLVRLLEGLEAGARHRGSVAWSFVRAVVRGFLAVVVVVGDERREGAKSRHLTLKKLSQTLKACAKGHVICRTVRTEVRVQWPAPHVGSNLNDHCHTLSR